MHAYTYSTFRYIYFLNTQYSLLCLPVCSVTTSSAYPCRVGAAPHNHCPNHQRDWDPDPDPRCQRHQSAADEWVQILFQPLWQGTARYHFRFTFWVTDIMQSEQSRAGGGSKLVFSYGPVTVKIMTKMPSLERCLCARCWMLPDLGAAFSSWSYIDPNQFLVGRGD